MHVMSSGAFLLAFLAAFDAGDRVAVASASYPCYRNILNALGYAIIHRIKHLLLRFSFVISGNAHACTVRAYSTAAALPTPTRSKFYAIRFNAFKL
jgi:hypothetical protein